MKPGRVLKRKFGHLQGEENMNRQERRVQKAIDELIKIQDDGCGTSEVEYALDALRGLESYFSDAWRKPTSNNYLTRHPDADTPSCLGGPEK